MLGNWRHYYSQCQHLVLLPCTTGKTKALSVHEAWTVVATKAKVQVRGGCSPAGALHNHFTTTFQLFGPTACL